MVTDKFPFAWSRIWTKLFVIVVTIALAAQLYSFLSFRTEITERRLAFCESENASNQKQRRLWDQIITLSSQDDDEPRTAADEVREQQFIAFLKETFPIKECR